MVSIDGDEVCVQRLFCVVCGVDVARTFVANTRPAIPVCRTHRGPNLSIWASWEWLRDRLKEPGDKWLEEYGGLQGMRDLPQPIWEAVEEWIE
jgi:hypothetical protein